MMTNIFSLSLSVAATCLKLIGVAVLATSLITSGCSNQESQADDSADTMGAARPNDSSVLPGLVRHNVLMALPHEGGPKQCFRWIGLNGKNFDTLVALANKSDWSGMAQLLTIKEARTFDELGLKAITPEAVIAELKAQEVELVRMLDDIIKSDNWKKLVSSFKALDLDERLHDVREAILFVNSRRYQLGQPLSRFWRSGTYDAMANALNRIGKSMPLEQVKDICASWSDPDELSARIEANAATL